MECAEDLIYPSEARTPELQRFNSHTLGCYPSTAVNGIHTSVASAPINDGSGRIDNRAEEEEGWVSNNAPFELKVNAPADMGQQTSMDIPCTPPTVSRSSWMQLRMRDDGAFESASASGQRACARDAPFQLSPTSFAPPTHTTAEAASELHGVRSVSCPSTNRSVAPARHSLECTTLGGGRGGSVGCHTTMLGCLGLNGSGLQDTPRARRSGNTPLNAVLAARPTILIHSAATPLTSKGEGRHYAADAFSSRRGGQCGSTGAADANDHNFHSDEHPLFTHPYADGSVVAAVPRLSRFSGGSNGSCCSPGVVNSRIGRPTTLHFLDPDLGMYQQLGDKSNNGNGNDDPWIGGVTQVWSGSTDLHGPTGVPRHSGTGVNDVERRTGAQTVGVVIPTDLLSQRMFSPSPEATWRPLAIAGTASQSDAHGLASCRALFGDAQTNEESAEAKEATSNQDSITSAVQNASLTGLGDAPRKSYVRSTIGSPMSEGVDSGDGGTTTTNESTAWDTKKRVNNGVRAVYSNPSVAQPRGPNGLGTTAKQMRSAAAATSNPSLYANSQHQQVQHQRHWLYADAPAHAAGPVRGDATPQGRMFMPDGQPSDAIAADAVAAQLARLSLQASPTQKRLAFEEEEDGLEGSRSSGGGGSEGNNRSSASTAAAGVRAGGDIAGSTDNTFAARNRWAAKSCSSAYGGGGRGGVSFTGLQLLRSRKRCLEDMQATDVEDVGEVEHTVVDGVSFTTGRAMNSSYAQRGALSLTALLHENLKRHRPEDQHCQRQQHLLPGEGNANDLIPASMRVGATPSVYSGTTYAVKHGSCSQETSQSPQQLLPTHSEGSSWSQLSSISYVTPSSQSFSNGIMDTLGHASLSHHEGRSAGGTVAVACASAACSQVLSSLPTNVTPRSSQHKQ